MSFDKKMPATSSDYSAMLDNAQADLQRLTQQGPIAVLMGGEASEREISLQSGRAVVDGLRKLSIEVVAVDTASKVIETLQRLKPSMAFLALHGKGGEDGSMQALLEQLGIPYTGSGVLGAALAMDKIRTKRLWSGMGLPTPAFFRLDQSSDFGQILKQLGGSVFVKPATEGSSFGMGIANTEQELQQAYRQAEKFDDDVLVEQFITGSEYTVALLNNVLLPSIRIETKRKFYDFQAKYQDDDTSFSVPSGLSAAEEGELQKLARQAFDAVGCKVWGRVDFMRDQTSGQFYLLEVNTIPGLTSHSLVPMAAAAAGFAFEQLIAQIISASIKEAEKLC